MKETILLLTHICQREICDLMSQIHCETPDRICGRYVTYTYLWMCTSSCFFFVQSVGRRYPLYRKLRLHGSEMTKHEACCLWNCADMFHFVRALQHIHTISHSLPTLGEASGNFRGSADSLYHALWLQLQLFKISFYCKIVSWMHPKYKYIQYRTFISTINTFLSSDDGSSAGVCALIER